MFIQCGALRECGLLGAWNEKTLPQVFRYRNFPT